jgi:hypothetical protein
MALSSEDSLRLNVLMAQKPQAIRIDESRLIVHALTDKGEAKVQLNPNCLEDKYLKQVRELLSTHFLGSPGGYPVYLRRWTRMGQERDDESLGRLLLLGEPEAVVAVVHAAHISDEIASRAWWAMSTSNNARRLLNHQEVVEGSTGRQLAEFLIEFLPFEEEQWAIGESVRLILQPGLISDAEREKLWGHGKRKNTYLLGFLAADPDDLPEEVPASPLFEAARDALEELAESNAYAHQLLRLLSPRGQAFLGTLDKVIKKPNNQDVVIGYLRVLSHYFESTCPECAPQSGVNHTRLHELEGSEVDMQSLIRLAQEYMQAGSDEALKVVMDRVPALSDELEALLTLSMVSELVINPIFARTDAIGTLMRKKLEPVSDPILERTGLLQGRKPRRT